MADTPNYEIDYDSKEFKDLNTAKHNDLVDAQKDHNRAMGTINENEKSALDAIEKKKNESIKIQNEQHEFALEQIEQGKEKAQKDYIKEQSGAYVDYKKQSGTYGSTAESMAANGLAGSGYAESSLVSMYNSYQNRIAVAREAHAMVMQGFDNQMEQARIQNNSILAEIALEALEKSNEIIIAAATQRSSLLSDFAKTKREIKSDYYNRYMQVVSKIMAENELKEKARQFDASMAEEKRQFNILHPATTGLTVKGGSNSSSKKSNTQKMKANNAKEAITGKVTTNEPKTFTTYEAAADYMQSKGISGDGGLLTKSEWTRRKASGSKRAAYAYSSYSDYLTNYVNYKVNG